MAHCKSTFYHIRMNVNTGELRSIVVRTSMNKNAMLWIIIHGPNPLGLKILSSWTFENVAITQYGSLEASKQWIVLGLQSECLRRAMHYISQIVNDLVIWLSVEQHV